MNEIDPLVVTISSLSPPTQSYGTIIVPQKNHLLNTHLHLLLDFLKLNDILSSRDSSLL